ncbi:hypothetical protein GMSM_07770 [Geomonas sp. Red276]
MIRPDRIRKLRDISLRGRREPPAPPDFRALFEAVPDPCLVLDREFVIVAVNEAYLKATLTLREEIAGLGIHDVFRDDEGGEGTGLADLIASLRRVIQTRRPDTMPITRYDIEPPASEGGGHLVRFWSPINAPVLGSRGDVAWIIHRVQDVTEFVVKNEAAPGSAASAPEGGLDRAASEVLARSREVGELNRELKTTLDSLHASQQLFGAFMDNLPAAAWMKDTEGRYVFANRHMGSLFTVSVEDLIGKVGEEVFPPPLAAQFRESDRVVLEKGVSDTPFEVVRPAGEGERYLMVSKFPIPGPDGRLELVGGLAFDMTDTRRLEAEVERALLQLEAVLEGITEGVIISDMEGNLLTMNREALALHEFESVVDIRRHLSEFPSRFQLFDLRRNPVPLDQWPLSRALRGERFVDYQLWVSCRHCGKEWIGNYSGTPVADREGKNMLAVLTLRDITARKQMEQQINALNQDLATRVRELEEVNQELEAFNRMVSHDLRQPLNTISTSCQAIEMVCGAGMDDDCRRFLKVARDKVLAMNQLIGSLLAFSRSGHSEVKRERVNLSELAREVAADMGLLDASRRVDFRIASGLVADCDSNLLRSVLENLLGNAYKYTAQKDLAVVEFGSERRAGDELFFVRDNGQGFDMALSGQLFSPFRRLPGAESKAGFGIGLATVDKIIRRHGGRVCAEGAPGEGATFYFTLPPAKGGGEKAG